MEHLGDDNFLLYAMRNYDAPTCSDLEEFNNEIKRFGYITRAFKLDAVNSRLILNHIIVLYNVFGEAATNMLFFKVEKQHWGYLVPFLVYLNRLSDDALSNVMCDGIKLNGDIIEDLRTL